MPKVKAIIEYNGNAFLGFQRQTHTKQTITTHIEEALKSLNIETSITGSGRTDTGVHASNQVIDFAVPSYWKDLKKLKRSLNKVLENIRFKHIVFVDDDFHSRFHAKYRIYRYVFKTSQPSIFEKDFVAHYAHFNKQKVQEALKAFEGEHDFTLLSKTGSPTHTNVRTIFKTCYKERKGYHFIYFKANGFLRAQVRMMVKLALIYSQGRITKEELLSQINNKDKVSNQLAQPQGLYLSRVLY